MSGLQVTFQTENKWFLVIQCCPQVKCGVPQGSILGPFLLIIHECYLSYLLIVKYHLYAGDNTVFYSNSNLNNMYNTINGELI